jgi:hypothetical protein
VSTIQISVIGATLKNQEQLIGQLPEDLEDKVPFVRANAASRPIPASPAHLIL